ncbi:MAG TPA: hypothetical protein VNL71_14060 [Chloroflexota bacterium]|nr:hypothetical protein [Chloroflexota bacterium]
MARVAFYPRCAPYQGPPDKTRQQDIARFIQQALKLSEGEVSFAEEPIALSTMVQAGVAVTASVDINNTTAHQRFVAALEELLRAVGLTVLEVVVQQVVDSMMAGILTGAAAGSGVGSAAGVATKNTDAATDGMILGAVLGALFGGIVGSSLRRHGPVLGVWKRGPEQVLRWEPAEQIVPVDVRVRPRGAERFQGSG